MEVLGSSTGPKLQGAGHEGHKKLHASIVHVSLANYDLGFDSPQGKLQ